MKLQQTPDGVAAAVDNTRHTDTGSADGLCPGPCDFSVLAADIGAPYNSVPLLKANKLSDGRRMLPVCFDAEGVHSIPEQNCPSVMQVWRPVTFGSCSAGQTASFPVRNANVHCHFQTRSPFRATFS